MLCPGCKQEFRDDDAKSCPHCGCPIGWWDRFWLALPDRRDAVFCFIFATIFAGYCWSTGQQFLGVVLVLLSWAALRIKLGFVPPEKQKREEEEEEEREEDFFLTGWERDQKREAKRKREAEKQTD